MNPLVLPTNTSTFLSRPTIQCLSTSEPGMKAVMVGKACHTWLWAHASAHAYKHMHTTPCKSHIQPDAHIHSHSVTDSHPPTRRDSQLESHALTLTHAHTDSRSPTNAQKLYSHNVCVSV